MSSLRIPFQARAALSAGLLSAGLLVFAPSAQGAEPVDEASALQTMGEAVREAGHGVRDRASALIDHGLSFLGIRYRYGGNGPESGGFDCSGLVRRVFGDSLGIELPRTSKAMSGQGEKVERGELKPGDLVFFNTLRRAFSHVGIYLGDNKFLHAPSRGAKVRVEDMSTRYWQKRFNGARRIMAPEVADVPGAVEQSTVPANSEPAVGASI